MDMKLSYYSPVEPWTTAWHHDFCYCSATPVVLRLDGKVNAGLVTWNITKDSARTRMVSLAEGSYLQAATGATASSR